MAGSQYRLFRKFARIFSSFLLPQMTRFVISGSFITLGPLRCFGYLGIDGTLCLFGCLQHGGPLPRFGFLFHNGAQDRSGFLSIGWRANCFWVSMIDGTLRVFGLQGKYGTLGVPGFLKHPGSLLHMGSNSLTRQSLEKSQRRSHASPLAMAFNSSMDLLASSAFCFCAINCKMFCRCAACSTRCA